MKTADMEESKVSAPPQSNRPSECEAHCFFLTKNIVRQQFAMIKQQQQYSGVPTSNSRLNAMAIGSTMPAGDQQFHLPNLRAEGTPYVSGQVTNVLQDTTHQVPGYGG